MYMNILHFFFQTCIKI